MKNIWKIIIVLILVSAVVAVVAVKKAENKEPQEPVLISAAIKSVETNEANQPAAKSAEPNNGGLVMKVDVVAPAAIPVEPPKLPRLVDLGADKCIPCKMMAPILDELSTEYKDKLRVDFIDVWKSPGEGQKFGIRVIPTQIFIGANGKELFRHEGFFSKEDILAKWKELGFDFKKKD